MASLNKGKGFQTPKKKSPRTSDQSDIGMASQHVSSTSQRSPSSASNSKKSPRTPRTGSPAATAKYSPHFSRKKRRKLFKDLSSAPAAPDEPTPAESCSKSTIEDFFSRAKPQKLVPCPICQEQVALSSINKHLDNGCLDLAAKDRDDFVKKTTKSKVKRAGSVKSGTKKNETGAALSLSPARKIAEVKSDLKDRRTRLRLKRKMESHSLYSSDRSSSSVSETVESSNILPTKSSRISSCSVSERVVSSEYFNHMNGEENSNQNSEILKLPRSIRRLSTHSTKTQGLRITSIKEGDWPLRLSQEDEQHTASLERKLSNASECSTVILSSQSQDIPEAQEDVFMMYSNSSVNCCSQEATSDVPYDTSPEYSHKLSISKSGYLKFDNRMSTQRLKCSSVASDGENSISENGDTTPDSVTPTSFISGTDAFSGISSQTSCSGKSSFPAQTEDTPTTSSQASNDDSAQGEGLTPINWNDDCSLSFTSSQTYQKDQTFLEPCTRTSKKASPVESSPPCQTIIPTSSNSFPGKSNSLKGFSLETSPLRSSSSRISQKGTPSKRSAQAMSPANSPWKYRDPYFLANFKLILNTVLANEDDQSLFNDQDMAVIDAFRDLSAPSQQLYVRLFQRKHAWLQVAKLDYKRIADDLTPVAAELHEAGLIQREHDLNDFEAALTLCPAPDLKTVARTLRLAPSVGHTKQDLVAALLKHGRQQRSLFAVSMEQVLMKKVKKMLGPCLRLSDEPRIIFSRLLLLFSLTTDMEDEDKASGGMAQLQTLLLSNMGKVIYPTYKVMRTVKIFATRDDLLRYETALHYENDIATAMSTNDCELAYQLQQTAMNTYQQTQRDHKILEQDLRLPVFLRRFTASWTYVRIMYTGVEILQKLRRYAEAVDTLRQLLDQTNYCHDSRGRWWDRLALNLDQHLKKPEQVLDAIKEGLADSNVRTGHRLALQLRAQKILKSSGYKRLKKQRDEFIFDPVREMPRVTIEGQVLSYQAPGIKNTFVREWTGGKKHDGDMAICRVEEIALQHYKGLGYEEGVHGEGSTFTTLIFLLFWDLIFMDGIPDTFCYPYQSGPLDMRSDAFFPNRQEALETRLSEIRQADSSELQDRLEGSWNEYNKEQCSGVRWELFNDLPHAQSLLACLGGKFLSSVAERILKDHRHCRGGMPDLTVWSPQLGKFKLVEVKGPGDRLSQKQILWIDFFLSQGVDVEVCHVTAVGSKRLKLTRTLSRKSDAASSSSQN